MKKVRFATIGTSAITELFLKGAVLEPRFEYAEHIPGMPAMLFVSHGSMGPGRFLVAGGAGGV